VSTSKTASRSATGSRRPVLAGVAAEVRRDTALPGLDHTGLMLAATLRALDDAGVEGTTVDAIVVPRGSWSKGNPAGRIADEIGATTARTVIAELGITQTSAMRIAFDAIADGADVVVVVGGETRHRDAVAKRAGGSWSIDVAAMERASASGPADVEPDQVVAPAESLVSAVEVQRHFAVPANQYAIVESAIRHRAGRTPAEHRTHLGRLWHRFAEVAASNPDAWNRTNPSADDIVTATPSNRLIAAPYTKSLVSQWTVDQAAAMVFVSAELAAGLADRSRLIYPLAAAESNLMVPLAERADLDRWPAMGLCGQRALADAGLSIADVDLIDLYSCFPAAVQVSAAEIGVSDDVPWTVTGGMTFGGGPLNNYTFQSVVKIAELLRTQPGSTGLTTSVSGFLTKPAVAIWSSSPDAVDAPCTWSDVTDDAVAATARTPFDAEATGTGTIAGYTVLPGPDGSPQRTVAVVEINGERTIVISEDPRIAGDLLGRDGVGAVVDVLVAGQLNALR